MAAARLVAGGWALLFLAACATARRESVVIPPGLTEWQLVYARDYGEGAGVEVQFVPEGETLDGWTRILTLELLEADRRSARRAMTGWLAELQADCQVLGSVVHHAGRGDALAEWWIRNCPEHEDRHELVRMLRGRAGLHRIAYTERRAVIPPARRETWLSWLETVRLEAGQPGPPAPPASAPGPAAP